jgi:hypothetical protein
LLHGLKHLGLWPRACRQRCFRGSHRHDRCAVSKCRKPFLLPCPFYGAKCVRQLVPNRPTLFADTNTLCCVPSRAAAPWKCEWSKHTPRLIRYCKSPGAEAYISHDLQSI